MLLSEAWEGDNPALSRAATRGAEAIAEVARLRIAVSALLPIAIQLQASCANGDTVDYNNPHDARAGDEFAAAIEQARAALSAGERKGE
jgi:hypothetical protein